MMILGTPARRVSAPWNKASLAVISHAGIPMNCLANEYGTYSGATIGTRASTIGKCPSFSGGTEKIVFQGAPIVQRDVTIGMIVHHRGAFGTNDTVCSTAALSSAGYTIRNQGFTLNIAGVANVDSGMSISQDTPVFLVCSKDLKAGVTRFFIKHLTNNTVIWTAVADTNLAGNGDGYFAIGGTGGGTGNSWLGEIAMVYIEFSAFPIMRINQWLDNPWAPFMPESQYAKWAPPAVAGGFNPGWAYGATKIIGGAF